MPITLLDLILLAVMLISALLAMVRGFLREVFSIAAWVLAAIATVYAFPRLLPVAKQYVSQDLVATAVVVAGVFLGTLMIVSLVTMKISDVVLDSRIGALDRTLGFMFGLGRGLLIVVVAFLFFVWLVPERGQPDWVRNAKSKVVLTSTGSWLMSMLPQDLDTSFMERFKPREGGEPPGPPGQRS
jgi:membrane protein required for colicin V production